MSLDTRPGTSLINLGPLGFHPGQYYDEYKEDIDLFGISVATNVEGIAVAAEASFRPNHPIQINTQQALASLAGPNGSNIPFQPGGPADVYIQDGRITGFIEVEQVKAQISLIKFFDQVLGAARWTVLAEGGLEHIHFGDGQAPGVFYGGGPQYGVPGRGNLPAGDLGDNTGQTITPFSYGYRLRASGSYPNAFMGVNVSPSITWTHDINGNSSDGQFIVNRKGVGLGMSFDYLSTYTLDLNYVNFFDGNYHAGTDRDFASISGKVQF